MAQPVIFIFGLGYVGCALAKMMEAIGWSIRGTTRQPEKLAKEIASGWEVIPFSDQQKMPMSARAVDGVSAILSTISAISGKDPVLDQHENDLIGFDGWVGYISATSVYPDKPNGVCYEDTEPDPVTARGKARLRAEKKWQELFNAEIFRAAGIYGPGRSPFNNLREGTARIIENKGQLFNRIHRDDICRIIIAAQAKPRPGRITNLADKEPASQGDVMRYAANLLGVEPPKPQTLEKANLSPMARSFYVSRRQVGSHVIEPELGIDLLYPDYKLGLASVLKAEGHKIS